RTPYVILDDEGRIIVVLVGRPVESPERKPEDRWEASGERVAELFEKVRAKHPELFPPGVEHRRGVYTALNVGISHGGGPKVRRLQQHEARSHLLPSFPFAETLKRTAGACAAYYPKPYQDMCEALASLYARCPELKTNFKNSAYPMVCFNLGPNTVTFEHNDLKNYPTLPCVITAFGPFNPDTGGHLYLSDLKIKIRFPPGSSILLPSAGLRHGNSAIQAGERRYSMTQYCSGDLMRWIRHGLRPAGSLTKAERERLDADRWEEQLGRLSKLSELEEDRRQLKEWETARAATDQ
ncbi:hypothetical protein FA95DRAFT_1499162, partial [Auriscalpium vulgare]